MVGAVALLSLILGVLMVERYRPVKPPRYSVPRTGMGGAPTKYKLEYCEEIIESGKAGYSLTAFAGSIGVCRETVRQWRNKYPEFAEAAAVAAACAAVVWESKLIALADGEPGNVTAVIFALKNRVGEDWRDRTITEHTGKDEGPINIEITAEMARTMSDEKLAVLEDLLRMIERGELTPQLALPSKVPVIEGKIN
jgi:transposase-like protein